MCVLGTTNPALLSSNEYSISSLISSMALAALYGTTLRGAGVMAVCMGMDTVDGVEGMGIGIAIGVLFSSSTLGFGIGIVFTGVDSVF